MDIHTILPMVDSMLSLLPGIWNLGGLATRNNDESSWKVVIPSPMLLARFHPRHIRFKRPKNENDEIWCNDAVMDGSPPGRLNPLLIMLNAAPVERINDYI